MNKKISDFKTRFNKALSLRNIKPIDLSEKTSISKSTISHYMSGYSKPKPDKLFILAKALNVNESWLMGLDVPMERDHYAEFISPNSICFEITARSLKHSPEIYEAFCNSLKDICSRKETNYVFTDGIREYKNVYEFFVDAETSFEEKARFLKSIVDFSIYDMEKGTLNIIYAAEKNPEEDILERIAYNCQKLNHAGLSKVDDYVSDVSSMNAYVKTSSISNNTLLNAAHDDETSTPEERQAGDDIMMDDSEWE